MRWSYETVNFNGVTEQGLVFGKMLAAAVEDFLRYQTESDVVVARTSRFNIKPEMHAWLNRKTKGELNGDRKRTA